MGNCWASHSHDPAHVSPKPSSDPFHENSKGKALPLGEIITPTLKVFTLAELKSATRNFRPDTKVGAGNFWTVFKGRVDENTYAPSRPGVGMTVAVKKSIYRIEEIVKWQSVVKALGKFSHPNLVKLLGYCAEEGKQFLVCEYMSKGSLESHLFRNGADTLSWERRINIALGAAQGFSFLHATGKQAMYRDFKAAKILLDGDYNAKLSDFGLATDDFSNEPIEVMGTYGYTAPEYMICGPRVESDIWGFGVMLLELISGLRVIDVGRPTRECSWQERDKHFPQEKRELLKIIDPRLRNQIPPKAALQTAQLILKCMEHGYKKRPSMQEVLETMQEIVLWK